MAGRMKKEAKAAAQADLAQGVDPETVMAKHKIKSRRTVDAWMNAAKSTESKTDGNETRPPNPANPAHPADTAEAVGMGEAEVILTIVRFGVAFTSRTAGMVVGFAPTSPVVATMAKLTEDEESMIRSCAPSLVPSFHRLLKWMDKHGVAVFAVMFGGMMLPRMVTLAMAAKQVKRMQKERAAATPETARNGSGPAPAPNRSGSDAREGRPVIPLYPPTPKDET
jgi:hypothetical protein